MLSIEQLTVVAYVGDGEFLCRECGEAAHLPTSDAICAYAMESQSSGNGEYCGECGKEIVEPWEAEG